MAPARAALTLVLLLAFPVLAGCTTPEPQERVLLQETVEVGERLYSWGIEDFHAPGDLGGARTIRAEFETPGDMAGIGVRFAGRFDWSNVSAAVLTLRDPSGRAVLELNATAGNEDDVGTIHEFWTFNRVVPARVGTWKITMRGEGDIGQLDFQMHGIEARDTVTQRGFRVDDADGEVTARLYINGWGPTPRVFLDLPNGTAVPVPTNEYGEEAVLRFDPTEGDHRIRANTTGWAGNLGFQVKQAP